MATSLVWCGWLPLQDWAGQHYRQRAPAAALYLTHQCRPPQQDRIGGVERRGECRPPQQDRIGGVERRGEERRGGERRGEEVRGGEM